MWPVLAQFLPPGPETVIESNMGPKLVKMKKFDILKLQILIDLKSINCNKLRIPAPIESRFPAPIDQKSTNLR